jgi:Penicillin-Binding Protein C-terminus Family.
MYWFLDGKPIGVDSSGKGLFVDVEEGVHSVTVLSEGLTQTCRFNVIPAQTFFREMTEDKGNVLNE